MRIRKVALGKALKLTLLSSGLAFAAGAAWAEDGKKDDDEDEKKAPETIEKKTEEFEKVDGLFEFYTDPKSGEVFMEISEDQLGDEFIVFTHTENGLAEARTFRGQYRDSRVIKITRHYERLEFTEQNTSYYFDPNNAISKAKDANISPAIVASEKIEAITSTEDEDGDDRFLIKADGLFLSQKLHRVAPRSEAGRGIGSLSKEKTKFADIRTYPENVDLVVDYAFDKPAGGRGSAAVTDARAVQVKVQHSILTMPEEGYEPRFDDYRIGYFFDQVNDMTSRDAAPYRDMINRWRLEKKDPEAEISDPVKPITWWIENTTPVEFRDTIRAAALTWNQSFEKAGFSNAIEVKVQPDDAEWDAGDVRYNVLRWTSSPRPPFGGYGPSFANPRTGEILAADIMLEYSFLGNRLSFDRIFHPDREAAPGKERTVGFGAAGAQYAAGGHNRSLSYELAMNNQFAYAAIGEDTAAGNQLLKEALHYLVIHEIGHTLGLNHNMKGTSIYGPREVHDKTVTQGAPSGSIMDYPAINIAPLGMEQGDYYNQRPGFYDDWAIEFGYTPDLDEAALEAILAKSSDPRHAFGNDADDMRAPGKGIDPRVNVGDMSSDPVAYGVDRIELARSILPTLLERYDDEDSWQELIRAYYTTMGQIGGMGNIFTRQIGGVYVDRTKPGQQGEQDAPFTPVPYETQKAAMKALKDYIFAEDAFEIDPELTRHLQMQRRGFNFSNTEDPKIYGSILRYQITPLQHLLDADVMLRQTNSSIYGNKYSTKEMLLDLNDAIIGGDLRGNPGVSRRNLQAFYLSQLLQIATDNYYAIPSQNAAIIALKDVRARMGLQGGVFEFGLSAETKAHRVKLDRMMKAKGF